MTALAAHVHQPDPPACGEECRRAAGYPLSRWYIRPLAQLVAERLARTPIRPTHLTLAGLACAAGAAAVLVTRPDLAPVGAALVLAAWFFDRADGPLARVQGTASAFGAWLDGHVDELVDVGLHAAVAWAAAARTGTSLPWWLLIGFLGGKYLLMHGLLTEAALARRDPPCETRDRSLDRRSRLRALWNLPGNADVRIHLLLAALLSGWLTAELALIAAYYNLRWLVRCGLVARRMGGAPR